MLNNNMLNNSIYNLNPIGKPIQNAPIPQVNVFNNNVNQNIGNMTNANNINKKKSRIPLRASILSQSKKKRLNQSSKWNSKNLLRKIFRHQ